MADWTAVGSVGGLFFFFFYFRGGGRGGRVAGCPEEGAVAVDAPQLVQRRKEEEDARLCEGKCKFLQFSPDLRVSVKRLLSALPQCCPRREEYYNAGILKSKKKITENQ